MIGFDSLENGKMAQTVEELEKAIAQLPPEDLKEFRAWYEQFDAEEWDRQIEKDIGNGLLDDLAKAALAEHGEGKTRKL